MKDTLKPNPQSAQQVMQLLRGKYVSRSVSAAAELGIADALGDGTASVNELATQLQLHELSLLRLLRALVSIGVFESHGEDGREFSNNALSSVLRTDVPGSMRDAACWINSSAAWAAWGRLDHSVRTGKSAFEHVHGQMVFDYFEAHAAEGEAFQRAMSTVSEMIARAVVQSYDFRGCKLVVDVGGGRGALLREITRVHADVRGVLFDRPDALRSVDQLDEVPSRIELRSGSFFEEVPAGADIYVLKSVLHDWDDEACVRILRCCADAAPQGARVLIVDNLVGEGPGSAPTKLLDLEMLVMTHGGRERTQAEFRMLVERAGLTLERVLPTQSSTFILECGRQ